MEAAIALSLSVESYAAALPNPAVCPCSVLALPDPVAEKNPWPVFVSTRRISTVDLAV